MPANYRHPLSSEPWPAGRITDAYALGAESEYQADTPRGVITQHSWKSTIFAGTVRDYWIYKPAQYDPSTPTAYMVFQDGKNYVNVEGETRVPVVFDNLIHKKELPPIIGIFINPGTYSAAASGEKERSNRSFEYDTLSDTYVRFLIEEIIPEVGKSYNLSAAAKDHAICGASSGGICAFTAAWQRPDVFSKVLSMVGSYVNIACGKTGIEGGHNYPAMVRRVRPIKPIRVFLQAGSNDFEVIPEAGDWYLSNLEMEAALRFAQYDYKAVFGNGGHSGKHGGAILPDTLRWLWRSSNDE